MRSLKAYFYVIVSGAGLLATAVFLALQWDLDRTRSTFSAFGPDRTVPTIYLIVGSGVGGLIVYGLCRLMIRGVLILWELRRQQDRIRSEVRRAGKEGGSRRPASGGSGKSQNP
jgi:hypothetical protein